MALIATINPLNQFFALNGDPLNNGKLYFGEVNKDPEQFPVQMYWDEAGLVPALQPIRTTSGYPSRTGSPAILYCATEYSVRVRQSNDVQVFYLPKGGVGSLSFGQWVQSGITPVYSSPTTFTIVGNQTAAFEPRRRVRFSVTAGTVYGTIVSSVYGALTTVVMSMDSPGVLDAGLFSADLGLITATNTSLPTIIAGMVTFCTSAPVPASTTAYVGTSVYYTSEIPSSFRAPFNGTMSLMYTQNDTSTTGTRTYTFRKNGVDQTLTCVSAGFVTQASDLTNSFNFLAGDRINVKLVTAGSDAVFHTITAQMLHTA